ncbi:MAG: sulfatase-like hydrolase/transferase, partial [Chitinophagales bacterium]
TSLSNAPGLMGQGNTAGESVDDFQFAQLDDSLTTGMEDYAAADAAIEFINDYDADPSDFCNKPFFMAVGFHKPHLQLYVPEHYFLPDYISDFSEEPFDIPYNYPTGTFPYNGVVLSPQPENEYEDYDNLGFVGQSMAAPSIHNNFKEWSDTMEYLPFINDTLSDDERRDILTSSKIANATMAYLAAIKFVDEQLGRIWTELQEHPEIYTNTVIIVMSDHGYSLDEKKHWKKNSLWETDIRVPLIIADLRNINPQTSKIPVSLLDLFPTVCKYAMVDLPSFPDGTSYLDGKNIKPIIDNNLTICESPVVTIYKNEPGKQGACMEQFSVRNNQYHYIQYHSNNIDGDMTCDSSNSVVEEELYDIGINRETDPNEWNNLANDEEYAPVINYLKEFLPGGSLYTETAFTVNISHKTLPCFINNHTTVKLNTALYSATGNPIAGAAAAPYSFKWTNNLTGAIFYGKSYSFNTNSIPLLTFNSNDHITFYLEVTEIATGKLKAFATKTIFINKINAPVASYNLVIDVP